MGFINQQTSLGGTIMYWMVYDEHENKESIPSNYSYIYHKATYKATERYLGGPIS